MQAKEIIEVLAKNPELPVFVWEHDSYDGLSLEDAVAELRDYHKYDEFLKKSVVIPCVIIQSE
jgi:hypothetical protein